MVKIIKPPAPLPENSQKPVVFLAGSIDMGKAEPWQTEVETHFASHDWILLNPRRDTWDASWKQSIENPVFRAQVEWELAGLEMADLILMYFAPHSQSPITLLEMGLFAKSQKLWVCSPPGFWRRGNLEVISQHCGIPLYEDLPTMLQDITLALTASHHES